MSNFIRAKGEGSIPVKGWLWFLVYVAGSSLGGLILWALS